LLPLLLLLVWIRGRRVGPQGWPLLWKTRTNSDLCRLNQVFKLTYLFHWVGGGIFPEKTCMCRFMFGNVNYICSKYGWGNSTDTVTVHELLFNNVVSATETIWWQIRLILPMLLMRYIALKLIILYLSETLSMIRNLFYHLLTLYANCLCLPAIFIDKLS
jgi:hypothetical protein